MPIRLLVPNDHTHPFPARPLITLLALLARDERVTAVTEAADAGVRTGQFLPASQSEHSGTGPCRDAHDDAPTDEQSIFNEIDERLAGR